MRALSPVPLSEGEVVFIHLHSHMGRLLVCLACLVSSIPSLSVCAKTLSAPTGPPGSKKLLLPGQTKARAFLYHPTLEIVLQGFRRTIERIVLCAQRG